MSGQAPLSLRELQLAELELLVLFDRLCAQHGLRYSLCGGTLLGAVRHQGFIPWDDDIDVLMPRPDFQTFRALDRAELPDYAAIAPGGGDCPYPFAKLLDLRYAADTQYADRTADRYLWMDVFPVDGLPEDPQALTAVYQQAARWRRLQGLTHARLGRGQTRLRAMAKYLLKPLALAVGNRRCNAALERLAARLPFEQSALVGDIVGGIYGPGEAMNRAEFLKTTPVAFEGRSFPAMSCWDSYLTACHGDYMSLPPEAARKTHILSVYPTGEVFS